MTKVVFKDVKNTLLLDALAAAPGAILAELNRCIFPDRWETRIGFLSVNRIFLGHPLLHRG